MNLTHSVSNTAKRINAFLLRTILVLLVLFPFSDCEAVSSNTESAKPAAGNKIVRVGWYESSWNRTDPYGGRSGYAYEYQQKIAAYTGWKYEYVTTSWPKLLQMLQDGEIDLLSDVSYTEERAKNMLYSALPMGEEEYLIYVSNRNKSITLDDFASFNGKKAGINKGSVMKDHFTAWAEKYGIKADIVELTGGEKDWVQQLSRGNIDFFVGANIIKKGSSADRAIPLCKVGSSPFFFAVNKNRPDLLKELDAAMNRIQDENRFYNQQMYRKYFFGSDFGAYFTPSENDWLTRHGPIRVGYRSDFLPYCGKDEETGALTGALKDYLEMASAGVKNANLAFEPVPIPDMKSALEALRNGEVDCLFPVSYTDYEAERAGLLVTDPSMHAQVFAVIRKGHKKNYSLKEIESVAYVKGYHYHESFLKKHFPRWKMVPFDNSGERFHAVAARETDCFLITSYRLNILADQLSKFKLTAISTGVDMDYSFALQRENSPLYSILNKVSHLVPEAAVYSALAGYSYEEKKVSFKDYMEDNLAAVIACIATVATIILALLLFGARVQKKSSERQQLISAAETDEVSGLFNRGFFNEYAKRFLRMFPDWKMDAIVLDIEQFHAVNDLHGREFGDRVLRSLGEEIKAFLNSSGGIAGRIEADRFDIYCKHVEDYQALLDRFQKKLNELSRSVSIRLRMGVMPWQEGVESDEAFDRASSACSMVRGKNTHLMVYNDTIRNKENYNQRLLNDLRRAVEDREFKVYYQPKYNIQAEPPKLSSAEALIRWQHPELGLIPPGDFIPLFEGNGQISVVDKYVWAEAAWQIAAWKEKFGVEIPVSVNLSRVDIFDPGLEEILDGLITTNGIDRKLLKLEVTESAYTENAEELIKIMKGLRDKGYEIEMDDFGSGYSSLNMLSSMPVDVLKMDRGFILNIEHNEQDFRLVVLILEIARNLKMPVIAEGVETEKQITLLKNAGCDLVQGYYFSRPVPSEEFEQLIIRDRDRSL